ncbi:MAG TPA: glycosyltransferase family 39 protein [Terriglobia bacterium]|nr:glycosyltransferase family 39 protein [Terriglobia bacterium]
MNSANDSAPATRDRPNSRFSSGPAIVLYVAAVKLLVHLLTASRYGFFRNELYFLACADHLAWGYVDQPPLIAFITWFARHAFGDSLLGLRLLPAVAGAALVWLTGKITREMGGGRFAQALAAVAVLVAPSYMILQHWMTMNAFEPLMWMGCAWCVIRIINTGEPRYWVVFGLLAGVSMENKYTIAFFAAAIVIGLAASRERRFLMSRWIWTGGAIALLIFAPNLVWLVRHNFPFLELMSNIRRLGGAPSLADPFAFISDQITIMNQGLLPLWAAGLAWLLLSRAGNRYRVLGWAYVMLLILFITLDGKDYYLAPAYPVLFAGGAVAFEEVTRVRWAWSREAYFALVLLSGALVAPRAAPILPVDTYIRYSSPRGAVPGAPGYALPLYFADEFGWEEMTREVAKVYNGLPAAQRSDTAILAGNFGEAGAIDFFGAKYGLPKAICNHQSYWLWGPRNYSGKTVIMLGDVLEESSFTSVELAGRVDNPYSRPIEHFDIFLCRGLRVPLKDLWPKLKHWS